MNTAFRLVPLLAAVAISLMLPTPAAQAQTLKWASQGDPQTMDPHSQNESMTNMVNGQVYERLTRRDHKLNIVPGLATEWTQVNPLLWRVKLRQGVKFHGGQPFTADDVVYSIQRAKESTSQLSIYANAVGTPRKVDEQTVEFVLTAFNPIFLQHLDTLWIMSKSWSEANRATRPLDFKNKEEGFTSMNANGTGPYMLVTRQPGIKTVYKRNTNWWGKFEGNVQEIVLTPIANDATRLAALVSGELDFVLDPAPRDVARLRNTQGVKIIDGPENRLIFIGMDQGRDKLLYGQVPGDKNPFKDLRVRRALYQAIDVETLRSKLMNGLSVPTGGLTPASVAAFDDPKIEARFPFDIAGARKLMAEAGYADGFEVTLDCPNNRYINDEEICQALAAMWAQLKIKVRVSAMPRVLFFPKLEKLDTSLYLYGWGGAITDAESIFAPVFRNRGERGIGAYNYGNWRNDKFDSLAAQSSVEIDPKKREQLIKSALMELKEQFQVLPLHRQMIPWAARSNVSVVHRPDNWFEVAWVNIGPK
ncbi:ABC transporter substrate-binding protein [Paucibacter aquatile]|uniref:ABC transporter substrate-binding protein n=1 Tax=Kinneretia aquatilis TaxID=2070761 RepID=A0A2N8KVU3_9BURK|nr:ABC transporter substrate-binding protein [Paucibacter aquatile]PND37588.1 ABC transporter substrate-binding protein [Paucibacter aquatile]WIV96480.1 ABC transporter substrate-binding protein [Paucibacter aquatile]